MGSACGCFCSCGFDMVFCGCGPGIGASTATPSVMATGAVRRWWRRQPLPMDSSALYGSARLRRHLFSRGRRMRIAHEASQSTLSSKGSGDGRSRGASVLPDDAEHDHAAASSTALLKAAVRRSYYTADA